MKIIFLNNEKEKNRSLRNIYGVNETFLAPIIPITMGRPTYHHLTFVYFQHGCQNASQDNAMVKKISFKLYNEKAKKVTDYEVDDVTKVDN